MNLLVKVKRDQDGYYGIMRNEGDVFHISKPADLGSWMQPIGWEPVFETVRVPVRGKEDKFREKQVIVDAKEVESEENTSESKTDPVPFTELSRPDQLVAINKALKDLDHKNADLWTDQGLVKMEVVSEALGATVTRKDVEEANPEFKRVIPES